jgi:hypothetical protein
MILETDSSNFTTTTTGENSHIIQRKISLHIYLYIHILFNDAFSCSGLRYNVEWQDDQWIMN